MVQDSQQFTQLRKHLETAVVIPEKEWHFLSNFLVTVKIPKGKHLHKIGMLCKHLWFIEKGAIKVYENIHGQERNTHFFIENSLFIDYRSVIMEAPSLIGFKAVEDTTVVVIEYKLLLELYDKIPLFERIGRMMAERQLLTEFDLRLFLLNMDATQRYEHIMQNHPWIFQRFSLKDIASFIDIAPASLSRLRKFIQQGRTN